MNLLIVNDTFRSRVVHAPLGDFPLRRCGHAPKNLSKATSNIFDATRLTYLCHTHTHTHAHKYPLSRRIAGRINCQTWSKQRRPPLLPSFLYCISDCLSVLTFRGVRCRHLRGEESGAEHGLRQLPQRLIIYYEFYKY